MARKPVDPAADSAAARGGREAAPPLVPPAAARTFDLKNHRKRAAKAWTERRYWERLYLDAYDFAIPYRRPASRGGKGTSLLDRVYDSTAIISALRSAGQLKQELFGDKIFKLAPGPIAKVMAKKRGENIDALTKQLEDISTTVRAFFGAEFDTAAHEMCIDVLVGTGTLFPLAGDAERPVRWVCLPFDEVAIEVDAYGGVTLIAWKTKLSRRQIRDAFPTGQFPQEFLDKDNEDPEGEIEICQDFCRRGTSQAWDFYAYLEQGDVPIVTESYRSQPMAVPRYYRVPGEALGRGPILLSLPTVKVLNKVVELTLKAAAIQMLGLWGYRPGGAFNPDTARLAPGQFWPMQATGGVLGPDVVRLDAAAGKIDVSNIITRELRTQITAALHDEQLPTEGATPRSATEIMARMKRIAQNYLGAFARLTNETIPVIVRRVMEILYDAKLLDTDIRIDELLVTVEVLSPIAAAMRSQALQVIVEWMTLVAQVRGPQGLDLLAKVDDALVLIGRDMGVPSDLIMTAQEREALKAKLQAAAAQLAATQANAGGGAAAPAAT